MAPPSLDTLAASLRRLESRMAQSEDRQSVKRRALPDFILSPSQREILLLVIIVLLVTNRKAANV